MCNPVAAAVMSIGGSLYSGITGMQAAREQANAARMQSEYQARARTRRRRSRGRGRTRFRTFRSVSAPWRPRGARRRGLPALWWIPAPRRM